jgi:hypothetical protein
MVIIAHLDKLGYFWYLFPIDFHGGCGMLKGRLRIRGVRTAGEMVVITKRRYQSITVLSIYT